MSGLTNNIGYTFEVRAENTSGQGTGASATATPLRTLSAPTSFKATPADSQVTLSWDDPGDSSITKYEYRYRVTSQSAWNPDWANIPGSGATTTSFRVQSLTNGTEYTFQVRTVRMSTQGPGASATATPRDAPPAPTSFRAASGDTRVMLSWDNPNESSITKYEYRYRVTSARKWNPDWTDIPGSGATTTSYTVRNLLNNVSYTLEVRAVYRTEDGEDVRSHGASATSTPEGPPSVPSKPAILNVTGGDESLTAFWVGPVAEDRRAPITSYRVRYRLLGSSSWTSGSRADGDLSIWQNITGLTNRRAYEVQVAAVNRIGTGAWISGRGTPPGPQEPPEDPVDAALDVGALTAIWTAHFGSDEIHPDADGNLLRIESCTGSKSFRVFWAAPEGDDPNVEWDAHVITRHGAGTVSHYFGSSPNSSGYVSMHGTVSVVGTSSLSIRVRGRFDAGSWSKWSKPIGLFCAEE